MILSESIQVFEDLSVILSLGGYVLPIDGFTFELIFSQDHALVGILDLSNYDIETSDGTEVTLGNITPIQTLLSSGSDGTFLSDPGNANGESSLFFSAAHPFSISDVGTYLDLSSIGAPAVIRIREVVSSTTVKLEANFVLNSTQNGTLVWRHLSAVTRVIFTSTKMTNGATYSFRTRNLLDKLLNPFDVDTSFFATAANPKLSPNVTISDDGVLVANFGEAMRADYDLTNPEEYTITGPTAVEVTGVTQIDSNQVAIYTKGMGAGSYTLTVNATGTPKDIAGNPIDPTFNTAIFTGSIPLTIRSVFTDNGPVTKPALTMQSGTGAVINSFTDVMLPGAALTPNHIGLYISLSGGVINGGPFRILAVLSATTTTLQASFRLPDPNSGFLNWALVDPRNGQIADDPTDVTVRINNVPVTPAAVIGLLGQIVLNSTPAPTDDVKVDYNWICNPVVDVRRLNSREFRLNSWNRDVGFANNISQHKYRYNNTLIKPGSFVADDIQSVLDQPLLRGLHYRAYERAYTPVLNDPNLLILNTPTHRIAYPPMQRQLTEQFIRYEALTLPEGDPAAPWIRKGVGIASVSLGILTIQDNSTGVFPTGQPIFWVRGVDLSFPHVFAMAWRCEVPTISTFDGVFTGLAAGYSDELLSTIVGFITDGGINKIGFLRRGSTDNPADVTSWIGSFDLLGNPTFQPVEFDWTSLHSYRIFRDPLGVVKLFIDGSVTEIAKIAPDDRPFLEELNAPFDDIQDVFFGSVSRPAESTSKWDFVRYLSTPLNPQQTAPSSFVSYEANVVPELDTKPWTPVGFHGTETIISTDFLLLDSTSATDVNPEVVGLVGADFRGFVRLEPLLTAASEVVLDVGLDLRTFTFGVDPNGLMAAIDNGDRLLQLCFFPDKVTPKKSYGGRSLPENFSPYFWSSSGGETAEMVGRVLRITDTSIVDGKVYFVNDTAAPNMNDPNRVVLSTIDYILEFRVRVVSYTPDVSGFVGVFAQVFDSSRSVGVMLTEVLGVRYVQFHSDGVSVGPQFLFNWFDGHPHTYRAVKNTVGDLVSLFVDGGFLGSFAYSSFLPPPPDPTGQVSFGSSTPASSGAQSVVLWNYCNTWRVLSNQRHYVGLWKGTDPNSLTGFHLPLKTSGRDASVIGNALGDTVADFFVAGVVAGDLLVVDDGLNKGVYEIAGVSTPTTLTVLGTWPVSPSLVNYRIAKETDWAFQHKYRLLKSPTGDVNVFIDSVPTPIIQTTYSSIELPPSAAGVVSTLTGGVAGIAFGSFEPTALSQSSWDFVRYGITRSVTELRIVPPHQVLNQWNVMASPEHLQTSLPHTHTSFKSSSTGIPPKIDPDFLKNPALIAFTLLNESTPLVPETQSFEVRGPYATQEYVSALNRPEDVLNNSGNFTLNDGSVKFKLIVPDDVLYTSLDVIEQTAGVTDLLTPFCDDCGFESFDLHYQKEVCLTYTGDVLPENDTSAPTPWALISDTPSQVATSAFGGILTYSTGLVGTRTVYRNDTPLPDSPGLQTEVTFRLKLLNDSTGGTGDTQVRFGLSAPNMTMGLAFVTLPTAERYVLVYDLNSEIIVGSVSFDFLDGNYHTYRIVRDPALNQVSIFIDS